MHACRSTLEDPTFIPANAKKLDGTGEVAPEVDFVFDVKEVGFVSPADKDRVNDGVFIEVKKARVELSGDKGVIKPQAPPLTMFSVLRKHLEYETARVAQTPMMHLKEGEGGRRPAPPPPPDATTTTKGPGGGVLGQRLAGEWTTGGGATPAETVTFGADGAMTVVAANGTSQHRWAAAGTPQGESLTIRVAAAGADPASSDDKRTVSFIDNDQFEMTDAAGNRRYKRVGTAPANAGPAGKSPQEVMSMLAGTWENGEPLRYVFRIDGTYTASKGNQSMDGTWKVTSSSDQLLNIEMISKKGTKTSQQWDVGGRQSGEIQRLAPASATPFKRKS